MTDHPYSTRSKSKRVITGDEDNGLVDRDLKLVEEVEVLRQHVKSMYQVWLNGQKLPPPPPGFSDLLPTEAVLGCHASHLESSTKITKVKSVGDEKMTGRIKESLLQIKKQGDESFREFASRWREQAVKVRPHMKESEIVEVFLRVQEGDYYPHLLPALGKDFEEVIKIGEMVEEGLKTGRFMSYSDMKAVARGNDVARLHSVLQRGMRDQPCPYIQPQSQAYFQAPYNPPSHYSRPPEFQCPTFPPLYLPQGPQSYVQSRPHFQWRTTIPQSPFPPMQVYRPRANSNFHPRPEYMRKKKHPKETSRRISKPSDSVSKVDLNSGLVKGIQDSIAMDNAFETEEGDDHVDMQTSG